MVTELTSEHLLEDWTDGCRDVNRANILSRDFTTRNLRDAYADASLTRALSSIVGATEADHYPVAISKEGADPHCMWNSDALTGS